MQELAKNVKMIRRTVSVVVMANLLEILRMVVVVALMIVLLHAMQMLAAEVVMPKAVVKAEQAVKEAA